MQTATDSNSADQRCAYNYQYCNPTIDFAPAAGDSNLACYVCNTQDFNFFRCRTWTSTHNAQHIMIATTTIQFRLD